MGWQVKGQFVCYHRPVQRTGVNKSVSFARWQQGAGFVVPRTQLVSIIGIELWTFNWKIVLRINDGDVSP